MLRACHVTARTWEPWCPEMFTLPLALGSLGVENYLRNRSLLGALALRACHVAVRCWEPWCEELFALPIALLFGVSGPSWGSFWGDFGAHLGCLGALLGRLGDLLGVSWAVLGQSWEPFGRSWSVGKPKQREGKTTWNELMKITDFGLLGLS